MEKKKNNELVTQVTLSCSLDFYVDIIAEAQLQIEQLETNAWKLFFPT